jgi:CubicO group peptidase (beta-lactamase class C family)
MSWQRLPCLALPLIALIGCGHVPPSMERYAPLDALIETQARDLPVPGVSAALMVRGKLAWTGARGWADVDKRIRATPQTPFNIASLTKPMTGVVLMQLVERGKLSLDTPMQRYDPSFTDPRITVGHVLSMRSESDPPGSAYSYNGNRFGMLNAVIKGVSGEELAKAYSTRLIEPLGLTQTSPGSLADPAYAQGLGAERVAHYESIMARLAVPYNMYGGTEPVATLPPDPEPDAAANVVSTASDYARFADAVMRGRLLSRATLEAMWTAPVNAGGERFPYAYGWFVEEYRGHRLIYHYGYYPHAYSALALIVPERELVFVALANGGGLNAGNGIDPVEGHVLACAVLIEFVDPALPCAETAAANAARWRAQIPPPRHEMASDPAVLAQYTGSYRRPYGSPAKVFVDQGRLWWETTLGPYALSQEAPDRFFMKADNRTLVFVRDESGRVTRIDLSWPDEAETFSLPRL